MPQIILDLDDALCPSCERQIGFVGECPYCEADSFKGGLIRKLRIATILVAIAGSILLGLSSLFSTIPVLGIIDVNPSLNGHMVRLSGKIDGRIIISEAGDKVTFMFNDKTGRIKVVAQDEYAEALVSGEKKLKPGMSVDLVGQVLFDGGRSKLVVTRCNRL